MKGICLVDFLLLGLGLDQVLGDCKQLLATDKTGPCYEVVPKLLKINTGRISPNILYYDPDFVSKVLENSQPGTCKDRLRDSACLMAALRCKSLPDSIGMCHSFRHLTRTECATQSDLTNILDYLFSTRIKDTQCVDGQFKYHLNAPSRDCQAEDYIMTFGHCHHQPDGSHNRQIQYNLVSGVVCRQRQPLPTHEQPCDCTPADLRKIMVPIGINTCQRIIYIRPDPDCIITDFYDAYKSYEKNCSSIRPPDDVFFINDWNYAASKAAHSRHVKINNILTNCQKIPCLENERPESVPGVDYSIYRYQNCTMDDQNNRIVGYQCPTWKVTRDNMILSPRASGITTMFSLFLNISSEISRPVAVLRLYSDGPLREADRLIVRVDGFERYQWTAVENRQVLSGIPLPAITLHEGPIDLSIEFVRPYLPFRDDIKYPNALISSNIYLESLAIIPASAGSSILDDGSRSTVVNKTKFTSNENQNGSFNGIFKGLERTKTFAIFLAVLPVILVIILLWRFILMVTVRFCCFCWNRRSNFVSSPEEHFKQPAFA